MNKSPKEWSPITRRELDALVATQLTECNVDALTLFEKIRIEPKKVPFERKHVTDEIYAIAQIGNKVIYYDDTDDAFEVGAADEDGVLRNCGSGQFTLGQVLIQIQSGGR